jgi:hypothetical protein
VTSPARIFPRIVDVAGGTFYFVADMSDEMTGDARAFHSGTLF